MSPLRTIARDLVERRLWPVAALLAVALVAIPVVFLRPAPNAATEAPGPAPATAAPATPTDAAAPAAAAAPGDPTADPSVALTSSPFAAAFAGPLDLPPSMQGLLKATKGTDQRSQVADAPLRDPFSAGLAAAQSAPAPTKNESTPNPVGGAAASTPSSASAPAQQRSAATQSSTPAQSAPASTPVVQQSAPSTPSADPAPSTDSSPVSADARIFRTDISFGTTETAPLDSDATRLTAYPSSFNPVAVFLGVMRGGWGAVFMLRDGAQPVGQPPCRPTRSLCTWIILHSGESITLNAKDAATGAVTPYTLKVAAIREDKVSEEAALAANNKASSAGRCLLGPLAAYHYDAQTGTLALRPEMKDCRYASAPATGTDTGTPTDPAAPADPVAASPLPTP